MKRNLLGRSAKLAALVSAPALLVFALATITNAQTPGGGITPEGTPITVEAAPTFQPTPAATVTGGPTATPDLSIKTVIRIEADPQTAPIKRGTQFEARVMVDNVDHLAGFQFSISYDPKRLEAVKASGAGSTPGVTPILSIPGNAVDGRGLGDFLSTSARAGGIFCSGPADQDSQISATCVTNDAPVCWGGPAGPSGSGLLGAVTFKSKGGGPTTLTLSTGQLVLDDYADCTAVVVGTQGSLPNDCLPFRQDPNDNATEVSCQPDGTSGNVTQVSGDSVTGKTWWSIEGLGWGDSANLQLDGQTVLIPSRTENANVNLEDAGGGGSNTMLIVIIIVVAVIAAGAGAGGFFWYRNRQSGAGA